LGKQFGRCACGFTPAFGSVEGLRLSAVKPRLKPWSTWKPRHKQIPRGNDRQKGKGNYSAKGSVVIPLMTMKPSWMGHPAHEERENTGILRCAQDDGGKEGMTAERKGNGKGDC